jgi:adenylate kinase
LDHVVALVAPPDAFVSRLLARASVEGRADDTPATIAQRMEVYQHETAPLVAFYREQGLLREVSALGTPDEVFGRVLVAINVPARAAVASG